MREGEEAVVRGPDPMDDRLRASGVREWLFERDEIERAIALYLGLKTWGATTFNFELDSQSRVQSLVVRKLLSSSECKDDAEEPNHAQT